MAERRNTGLGGPCTLRIDRIGACSLVLGMLEYVLSESTRTSTL